jgi:porin
MNESTILSLTIATLLAGAASLRAGETTPATSSPAKPAATDATLFPIPKLAGSIWERERLLGDLGGPRQSLAEHGVQIDFNVTNTYQYVFAGSGTGWSEAVANSVQDRFQQLLTRGLAQAADRNTLLGGALTLPLNRLGGATLAQVLQQRIDRLDLAAPAPRDLNDGEYFGTWELELKLDLAKMGLWPGGFVYMRTEQQYGRSINPRSGVLLPQDIDTVLPDPGIDEVTIPHLYMVQFLAPQVAVLFGKLDTTTGDTNEFAHISGSDRFMGLAFAFNPVTALTTPYSTLGAGLLVLPTKDLTLNFTVFDTEGSPSISGFDTAFSGATTWSAEARLATNFFGKPGHQTLGGTYAAGDFVEFKQSLLAFIPGSSVALNRSGESWSVYWNFDQYLWNPTITTDPKSGPQIDPTRGVGIFGRIGFADEDTNPIAQFYSVGFGGKGLGSARPHDRWGVGYYYMKASNKLPDLVQLGDEQGVEVFYNFAITPALMITADLQVIDSAKNHTDTAVVGGVRATLRF